jgi:hypothetical protein
MKCIFCKEPSDNSKSVEHIIPESLGNIEHVLPPGVVCDSCNNYFATKIEKDVLEKAYFKNIRHRNIIPNKKGRLVKDKALIFHPKGGWVDMWLDQKGFIFQNEDSKLTNLIATGECNKLILSVIDQPDPNDLIVSRFLATAALESLAYKFVSEPDWINELVTKTELDPLREYARYGKGPFWNYNQRRIYSEEDRFTDPVHHPEPYEILHEMDFLYLDEKILYYALVIMGVEFVINLGESELSSYYRWMLSNEGRSPIRRFSEFMLPRSAKS